jgi:hypothetical protein
MFAVNIISSRPSADAADLASPPAAARRRRLRPVSVGPGSTRIRPAFYLFFSVRAPTLRPPGKNRWLLLESAALLITGHACSLSMMAMTDGASGGERTEATSPDGMSP